MSKVELPAHVVGSLQKVASDYGFKDASFDYSEGSDKGFIGLIKRCRISEGVRSMSIICKFLPANDEQNMKYDSFELFKREVFVYQTLLPQFEKLQLEHGLVRRDSNGFWSYPICYQSNYNSEQPSNSFILMEDLSEGKFEMKDTFKPSDYQHTRKLFIELGKFHAISFALRFKAPKVFDQFTNMNDLMCRLMSTPTMRHLAPRNCQLAADLFYQPDQQQIRDKILSYKSNIWIQMENILDGRKSEPFSAVCHGDCWINNVMYNYDDEAIKDIRLIDWQMTRFGSVASEVMYYLFCCNDKSFRDQHQSDLLEIYYASMRDLLLRFKLDVSEFFPFEKFTEQLKTFGKFAFAMAMFTMPIYCKYPEKLFDNKDAELTDGEKSAVTHYNEMMRNVIQDLVRMDVL